MGIRKPLSLSRKCEIFRSLKKGISVGSLSRRFGLRRTVILEIQKGSGRMVHFVRKIEFIRRSTTPRTEQELYKWLQGQRETSTVVTLTTLYKQAQVIHDELKETPDFSSSFLWVDRFKQRHQVTTTKVKKDQLVQKTPEDSYFPEQIYRADEMVLFWRVVPGKSSEHTPPEGRSPRECLTFLCCTNVSGSHKLEPLIISSTTDPDTVASFDSSIIYKSSEDSRMTPELFNEWFFNYFIQEVLSNLRERKLPGRALLLLDSSICNHPPAQQLTTGDGSIRTMLIPSTKIVDRNIASIEKFEYKRRLLKDLLANIDKPTLRHAIENLRLTWDDISVCAIERCWKKIMHDDEQYSVEDYIPLSKIRSELLDDRQSFKEIRELVDCLDGGEEILDEELNSWLLYDSGVVLPDPVEDEDSQMRQEMARVCLHSLIGWTQQNQTDPDPKIKIDEIIDLTPTDNFQQPQECTPEQSTSQD